MMGSSLTMLQKPAVTGCQSQERKVSSARRRRATQTRRACIQAASEYATTQLWPTLANCSHPSRDLKLGASEHVTAQVLSQRTLETCLQVRLQPSSGFPLHSRFAGWVAEVACPSLQAGRGWSGGDPWRQLQQSRIGKGEDLERARQDKTRTVAYGSSVLPSLPGHAELTCRTWRPLKRSIVDEARGWPALGLWSGWRLTLAGQGGDWSARE